MAAMPGCVKRKGNLRGAAEISHHDPASRPGDTRHLPEYSDRIRQVMKKGLGKDKIEGRIRKAEAIGVTQEESDTAGGILFPRRIPGGLNHGLGPVHSNHSEIRVSAGDLERNASRSGSYIQSTTGVYPEPEDLLDEGIIQRVKIVLSGG